MYAIIRAGGSQYRVEKGERLRIAKIAAVVGESVPFDEVLALHDGENLEVGAPLLASAKVTGRVVSHGRGRKIIVYRFKRRKGYHRKKGHRQDYNEVEIEIIVPG